MSNAELIDHLIAVKLSIIENANDVLWMSGQGSAGETVCERLDLILTALGYPEDELERHYQRGGG